MKTRNTCTHSELVQEVIRILRFPLDMKVLKVRLEGLIEGEYMSVDENRPNVYHYIA